MLLYSLIIISVILSGIIMTLAFLLSMKETFEIEKPSPFECGFLTMMNNWTPFSMHFFMSALIFLIFDIELVVLFPYLILMEMKLSVFMMAGAFLFLLILSLGFFLEWNQKFLEWSN